jgi:Heterokaryon incompatibility protein (HET)
MERIPSGQEPTYSYEPLPDSTSIRLVHIHPGDGPIVCSAASTHLSGTSYNALSYTWGDPNPRLAAETGDPWETSSAYFILCDARRLDVTRNLHDALCQLRILGIFEPLWVDAICIDQQNLDERRDQVAMMGEIYANAREVLVWLGKEEEDTKDAASLILSFATAFFASDLTKAVTNRCHFFDPSSFEYINHPPLNSGQWECISKIFARSWFTRGWVFQEVAIAQCPRVLCGPIELDYFAMTGCALFLNLSGALGSRIWEENCLLSEATRGFRTCNAIFSTILDRKPGTVAWQLLWPKGNSPHSKRSPSLLNTIFHWCHSFIQTGWKAVGISILIKLLKISPMQSRLAQRYGTMLTDTQLLYGYLEDLLQYFKNRHFSDKRDHVFAAMALAKARVQPGTKVMDWISPDYGSTAKEIYVAVSHLILRNTDSLVLLSLVDRTSTMLDLPSWVPDYSYMTQLPKPILECYNATKNWSSYTYRGQVDSLLVSSPGNKEQRSKYCYSAIHLVYAMALRYRLIASANQFAVEQISGDLLPVTIKVFDSVEDQSIVFQGGNQSGIEMCEAWWDMILHIPETYDLTGQNRIEVLWRTLIADRIVGFSESRPQDFSECFRLMVKLKYGRILIEGQEATETHSLFWRALTSYRELLKETSPERLAPEAEIEEYAASLKKAKHDNKLSAEDQRLLGKMYEELGKFDDNFVHSLSTASMQRRLIRTRSNALCLGPAQSQVGDLVCFLHGARVPFVLRKGSAVNRYELIGHIYVHGLMDGEVEIFGLEARDIFLE